MQYKIKIRQCTLELEEPLDRELTTLVSAEFDIYDVHKPALHNGEFDEVYVAKQNGKCLVTQGDKKPVLASRKLTNSQKLRYAISQINDTDGYYERLMPKLLARIEEVVELIEET